MPNDRNDGPNALDMTEALSSTLRTIISNTDTASEGVITAMIAAAAMQCFFREKCGPSACALIDAVSAALQHGLPPEKLARFVQVEIDGLREELTSEPEAEAPPTRFYGVA